MKQQRVELNFAIVDGVSHLLMAVSKSFNPRLDSLLMRFGGQSWTAVTLLDGQIAWFRRPTLVEQLDGVVDSVVRAHSFFISLEES